MHYMPELQLTLNFLLLSWAGLPRRVQKVLQSKGKHADATNSHSALCRFVQT